MLVGTSATHLQAAELTADDKLSLVEETNDPITVQNFLSLAKEVQSEIILNKVDALLASLASSTVRGQPKPPALMQQHQKLHDLLRKHFFGPQNTLDNKWNAGAQLYYTLASADPKQSFDEAFMGHIKELVVYYERQSAPKPNAP